MTAPHTSAQAYIDNFNARDYLQTSYAPGKGILFGEWIEFATRNLHETFTTDLLEQNRAEFKKWLNKDPDAFDWTPIIKRVCELEGNREDSEKKAEKLRSKVTQVMKCDALKRNPYDPVIVPPADCLLVSLCLEAPCKDMKSYCNVLKNFKNLLKPEGHILILSTLNSTYYHAGKKRFSVMSSKKEALEMAFKEAGYIIEKAVYTPRADKSKIDVADYEGHYFIHAHKSK
ncbi:nicotinamide N-methyltransferase-like isoform X2 [Bufo bufo]|uniref:nicotinamide N-methyltransferase-like isoform X2 n=1 Tax=Bufo bufo TaxID=8384 RepID=UPI001ABDB465|nr:nicotinamide N-methyltransferase-like isoform X2 [Bufo bufo]